MTDPEHIEVPPRPSTDAEFAELPVLPPEILEPVRDGWGTEITEGDIVVYPGRTGSGMWLVKARVLETGYALPVYAGTRGQHRPFIKAERLAEARWGRVKQATGKVTIHSVERVTVISWSDEA